MASDRQDFDAFRTDRPEAVALPSVGDVLAEDAVRRGDPEVLVGGAALEAPVRFWHLGTANSPGAGPWLTVLGASDCFSTTQSPASVPARPAAP